ncbi:hypothetical protein CEXT_317371 [Caerostris extrusa]|uniref:Uncharacterized protein n=1 Tax=Caerostris extrusa TaxID=172846 RepID=A0AAV4PIG7_CAEEX|nr:hypothetical protein CEXT_317371 [Caerostris extrusa]
MPACSECKKSSSHALPAALCLPIFLEIFPAHVLPEDSGEQRKTDWRFMGRFIKVIYSSLIKTTAPLICLVRRN